jgi:hypothetical protein
VEHAIEESEWIIGVLRFFRHGRLVKFREDQRHWWDLRLPIK